MKTRTLASLTAAAALTAAGLGLATPAHATAQLTDNGNGSITAAGVGGNVVLFFCDTSVSTAMCGRGGLNFASATTPGTYQDGSTVNIAGSPGPLPAGTYTVTIVKLSGLTVVAQLANATIGESTTEGVSGSTPPPVIQQFGKPNSITCDEAQPEGLDIGGASSGGWGESWAQWMNNGNGGPVCTRTLAYNNSTGKWSAS